MFAHSGGREAGLPSVLAQPSAHRPSPLPWGQEQSVVASDMGKIGVPPAKKANEKNPCNLVGWRIPFIPSKWLWCETFEMCNKVSILKDAHGSFLFMLMSEASNIEKHFLRSFLTLVHEMNHVRPILIIDTVRTTSPRLPNTF